MADRLEVVSPALFHALVAIDRNVPRRAREFLALLVNYVRAGLGVNVFFGNAKVDDVYCRFSRPPPDQEIFCFNFFENYFLMSPDAANLNLLKKQKLLVSIPGLMMSNNFY